MSAPEKVLGKAIRKLTVAPSKEWISGFDAGYDAAVVLVSDLVKLCENTQEDCGSIRKLLEEASIKVEWLRGKIGEFRHPIVYDSFISGDLRKK